MQFSRKATLSLCYKVGTPCNSRVEWKLRKNAGLQGKVSIGRLACCFILGLVDMRPEDMFSFACQLPSSACSMLVSRLAFRWIDGGNEGSKYTLSDARINVYVMREDEGRKRSYWAGVRTNERMLAV